MEVRLTVVGGKASKGSVTLSLPAVIGRSRDVALTVAHPMISRRHCELYEENGLLMLRDLGSLNGTIVAGQRISGAPLGRDGEFSIGPLTFRAECEHGGDFAAQLGPAASDDDVEELTDYEALDEEEPTPALPAPTPPPAVAQQPETQPVTETADEQLPDFLATVDSIAASGDDGLDDFFQRLH